jgi:hypothetical protein
VSFENTIISIHSLERASTQGIKYVFAHAGLFSSSILYDKAGRLKTCSVIIIASKFRFCISLHIFFDCLFVQRLSGNRKKKFG